MAPCLAFSKTQKVKMSFYLVMRLTDHDSKAVFLTFLLHSNAPMPGNWYHWKACTFSSDARIGMRKPHAKLKRRNGNNFGQVVLNHRSS